MTLLRRRVNLTNSNKKVGIFGSKMEPKEDDRVGSHYNSLKMKNFGIS